MSRRALLLGLAMLSAAGRPTAAAGPKPAGLVLTNAHIVTMDEKRPRAEALAVSGDRIAAVGSAKEIAAWIGPATRVLDLDGHFACPGLIEGHGHFLGLGQAKMRLDLTRARSWDEIVAMVGEAAAKARPGAWILGRGWHQEKWDRPPAPAVEGMPTLDQLSARSPANPVMLTHASGHAAIVNARALAAAGIGEKTPDPPGGTILRDARGRATGVLRENAQDLVRAKLTEWEAERTPAEAEADFRRAVGLASHEALSKGITTFHDAGSTFATIDLYKRLAESDSLPVRLYVMVRAESSADLEGKLAGYRMIGVGHDHLTVRAIKRYVDGALGTRGAWLLAPYADQPGSTGKNVEPLDDIARAADLAIRDGYQLCIHAIGDRGNREVLDLYERAFRGHPAAHDLRWRIEHAQHVATADVPRFAKLGVIAAMQGIHCTSDGPWVPARLGEKRAHEESYRWKDLLRSGAVIANGTDTPVEDVDPIACFYASVSRRLEDGSVFVPAQRMSREEALRSYTVSNAYAAFEEALKGSLAPGKLADVTVLSRDIMTVPEDQIAGARVLYTIVGGKVAYRAAEGTTEPRSAR